MLSRKGRLHDIDAETYLIREHQGAMLIGNFTPESRRYDFPANAAVITPAALTLAKV